MGKTVPSYRMALECEIERWRGFRNALPGVEAKEAFDILMDLCRVYASESSCATNPVIFEPMLISIVVGQQKRIHEIEEKLSEIYAELAGLPVVVQR